MGQELERVNNSNAYKKSEESKDKQPDNEKVVEPIANGKVVKGKAAEGFIRGLIRTNINKAKKYAFEEIENRINDSIDILFLGGTRSRSSRRNTYRYEDDGPYVSYNKMYEGPRNNRQPSSRSYDSLDTFEMLAYEDRGKAEEVLADLKWTIRKYGYVTVGYYYQLSHKTTRSSDFNFGWTRIDIDHARRIGGGDYVLDLPRPIPLD